MPQKRMVLIVGLGNPGENFRKTRHNAGFMVLDKVADSFSVILEKWRTLPDSQIGRGRIEHVECVLMKPMTFMNKSGPSVKKAAGFFSIPCKDVLVVHDDIDLAFGRLKIKEKGGDGGHQGVRSLIDALGEDHFNRLRLGVGRPEAGTSVTDHVLSRFNTDEEGVLNQVITIAQDAVVTILCSGTKEAMNKFNNSRIVISS
ncbi:MAG: aminoacyl-tRNA hydrolase [Desulfobacterales bacterium]|nr:MAG: aminoacyl-tRNA hydrolase [Desulfobacterales bacterium]